MDPYRVYVVFLPALYSTHTLYAPGESRGRIILQTEEVADSKYTISFQLSATKLDKKDFFGKVSAEEGRGGEVRSREGKEEEAEEGMEGQEIGGREGGIDRHWVGRRKREGERERKMWR